MHSFAYDDEELGEIVIHHNGDFSGEVHVTVSKKALESAWSSELVEVHLPFDLLQEFVMAKIRREIIIRLENTTGGELANVLSSI